MSRHQSALPAALADLGPFDHDVELAPGLYANPRVRRVRDLNDLLFPALLRWCGGTLQGLRVLDLACNCGGFSFLAKRYGAAEVVGIDARDHHIEQARALAAHLHVEKVSFVVGRVQDIDRGTLGRFDVVLMLGILYHLQDPLGTMKRVSDLGAPVMAVDSHVHFSTDANEEDYPRWWMLRDIDTGLPDGLFGQDITKAWHSYQAKTTVDYGRLPRQLHGSPHSQRECAFVRSRLESTAAHIPESQGSASGELVLVPNRRAVLDLLRHEGYEDVVEIVPHRFSPEPYLGRYRVCLIAMTRDPSGPFELSLIQQRRLTSQKGGA